MSLEELCLMAVSVKLRTPRTPPGSHSPPLLRREGSDRVVRPLLSRTDRIMFEGYTADRDDDKNLKSDLPEDLGDALFDPFRRKDRFGLIGTERLGVWDRLIVILCFL